MANEIYLKSGYTVIGNLVMVGFDSAIPGEGRLIFGNSCSSLLGSATYEMHAGTTAHDILVMTNDLPALTGFKDLATGARYAYQTVTVGHGQVAVDTNNGGCWTFTNSFPQVNDFPLTVFVEPSPLPFDSPATVVAITKPGAICTARVRYSTGRAPVSFRVYAQTVGSSGQVSWSWHEESEGFSGTATVNCRMGTQFSQDEFTFRILH